MRIKNWLNCSIHWVHHNFMIKNRNQFESWRLYIIQSSYLVSYYALLLVKKFALMSLCKLDLEFTSCISDIWYVFFCEFFSYLISVNDSFDSCFVRGLVIVTIHNTNHYTIEFNNEFRTHSCSSNSIFLY